MAVIQYRCTECDREIQLIERPQSLETIGRCIVTNKCKGNLYRVDRLEDYAVGKYPDDVTGLTNWIQRKVVYDHTQAIADTIWTVTHDLGVNPSVQVVVDRESVVDGVVTSSRIEIQPETITLVDENTLTLTFDRPESGLAQIIARSTRSTELVEAADPGVTYLPVTVDGILTLGINIDSGQFPATSSTTCTVRLYFLDQEDLTDTAFDTAVFNDYEVSTSVDTTSAWSDTSEIFVNGDVYTIVTLDIGDPINEFNAPSAGAVLFNAGRETTGFPYDQAPNMVVMLSNSPHLNADKSRNYIFRPDLEVGPALTLDSFIFANDELVVDASKTEKAFPPVYSISAAQSKNYVAPVAPSEGAFVMAFGSFGSEGDAFGVVYTSDNDITTWTGQNPSHNQTFAGAAGTVYAEDIDTWVHVSKRGSVTGAMWYSIDDGVTWTVSNNPPTATATGANDKNIAWSPSLALFLVGCNSGQIVSSTDGITWSNVSPGVFGSSQVTSVHWSEALGLFMACANANQVATSSTGTSGWTLVTNEPGGASSDDLEAIYSVGTRVFVSNDDDETVYYSDDIDNAGAGTWTQSVVDVKPTFSAGSFAANSDGSVIIWAGPGANSGNYVWRSTDNGVNFTRVDMAVGITTMRTYSVLYDPDYGFMVGGYDNDAFGGEPYPDNGRGRNLIVTSDDGLTWTIRVQDQFFHTGGSGSPNAYYDRTSIDSFASKNSTANGTP